MKPLVSIIVPIYNVENYLDECISSIVQQTYSNIEIILVDDGSPDLCPTICDNWKKKDKRIKVIHKKNGGLSSARNVGISNATGEYIGFVDSDDYISNDMVEKLLAGFCQKNNVGIVSGQIYKNINGDISSYNRNWEHKDINIIAPTEFAEKMILTYSNFTCWSKLYKKELLKNVRFYEGRNNEDSYFIFDLSKEVEKQNIYTIEVPSYIYYYRIRENSICRSTKIPLEIDVISNFTDFYNYYFSRNIRLANKIDEYIAYRILLFCKRICNVSLWRDSYFSSYKNLFSKNYSKHILKNRFFTKKDKIAAIILFLFPTLFIRYYKQRD